MTKKYSTDEVVTQGDEYLRAKAGELEKDSDTTPPPAQPGAAVPDGKPGGDAPPVPKTDL